LDSRPITGDDDDTTTTPLTSHRERKRNGEERGKKIMVILWINYYDDGLEWIGLYGLRWMQRIICCNTLYWESGHHDHAATDFMNFVVFNRVYVCFIDCVNVLCGLFVCESQVTPMRASSHIGGRTD